MNPSERDAVLARLDERTKYIKEKLDNHIAQPSCETCKLSDDVAKLQTNVSWIKRLGIGIPSALTAVLALYGKLKGVL